MNYYRDRKSDMMACRVFFLPMIQDEHVMNYDKYRISYMMAYRVFFLPIIQYLWINNFTFSDLVVKAQYVIHHTLHFFVCIITLTFILLRCVTIRKLFVTILAPCNFCTVCKFLQIFVFANFENLNESTYWIKLGYRHGKRNDSVYPKLGGEKQKENDNLRIFRQIARGR